MHHAPNALMLYAAGLGTRMGELTANCPKPLIRVAGQTLLDHALGVAGEAGVDRIVVNIHYLADMIRAHLAGRPRVTFSDEIGQLLETGGGLRAAIPSLGDGPVFALNSDAVWTGPNPLVTLASAWDDTRMDALLLLVPLAGATGHVGGGDFDLEPSGQLRRGRRFVYTGAQIIRTQCVAEIDRDVFSTNLVWDAVAARGRLFGAVHLGGWCDVGRPESIPLAETLLREARGA
jgi:MurNAc alpha-1-phosphate uridylyltransferase